MRSNRVIFGSTALFAAFQFATAYWETRKYVVENGNIGRLVSNCIGNTPEVQVHVRNQVRIAEKVGRPFDQQLWPHDII